MKLDQTFTVQADPDTVWKALTDVMRVAPNLPGAAITEDAGDGVFKGEFKVKIGPTTAAYNGQLKMEDLDEEQRVATMSARGTDKRGNGGATATIVSRVAADPDAGGTRVDVETDFSITGKLARFGRGGMIQDVSNRLLREFAGNLQEDLAGETGGGATAGTAPAPVVEGRMDPDGGAVEEAPAAVGELPGESDRDAAASGTQGSTGAQEPAATSRAPRPPAEPLDGGGLVFGVIADRLRDAAPAFLVGVVVGLLAARCNG